ncbi:MAG TPA: beta-N-acetylhexosaminidase [Bryobacteraceae bacterium]|nr:beta-N-acetylhexosaminidase [Bryobacteraceae bacterium]
MLSVLLLALAMAPSQDVSVIPRPALVEPAAGQWTLTPATAIVASSPGAAPEARKLARNLSLATGWDLAVAPAAKPGAITLALEPSRSDLGPEGYELRVQPGGVRIVASAPAGLFYGGVTLRQILPVDAWRKAPAVPISASSKAATWPVQCVRIVDHPRFSWRGLLLDPARHFLAKAEVLRMLDAMAMHKLNRLQLHLTDDQGWRLELSTFPRLTALSSWREGTLIGKLGDKPQRISSVPHGGYYSREDVREIVAYAADRHIVVVPEIEMPGHARAWLSAYPEYAVFPDRAAGMALWPVWGVSKDVLAPRPQTVEACRRLLDEVCELFPSPWIHIGGDEAPRDQWKESAEMQTLIRTLGVRNEDGLQAWFTAELSRHLAAKGRRLVGWDEILAGAELGKTGSRTALAPNAIVMSWRGEKGGRAAASAGHDVIMAPTDWTYLDYYQGPPGEEPLAIGGSVPLARTYSYEPVPEGMPESAARHVLGGQTQLWSEYMPDAGTVFRMAFPRAAALSEAFWTARDRRDLTGFLNRLDTHDARLRAAGIELRALARGTALPGPDGRIVLEAKKAVVLGTETKRTEDGSITNWKDPYTMLSWRAQIPAAATYRISVLIEGSPAAAANLELTVAGQTLRPASEPTTATNAIRFAPVTIANPGAYLIFLRQSSASAGTALPTIRGVEMTP